MLHQNISKLYLARSKLRVPDESNGAYFILRDNHYTITHGERWSLGGHVATIKSFLVFFHDIIVFFKKKMKPRCRPFTGQFQFGTKKTPQPSTIT